MRRRVHVQRVLKQPRARAQVHEGVPGSLVAGEAGDAATKLGRFLRYVSTQGLALVVLGRGGRGKIGRPSGRIHAHPRGDGSSRVLVVARGMLRRIVDLGPEAYG